MANTSSAEEFPSGSLQSLLTADMAPTLVSPFHLNTDIKVNSIQNRFHQPHGTAYFCLENKINNSIARIRLWGRHHSSEDACRHTTTREEK